MTGTIVGVDALGFITEGNKDCQIIMTSQMLNGIIIR